MVRNLCSIDCLITVYIGASDIEGESVYILSFIVSQDSLLFEVHVLKRVY